MSVTAAASPAVPMPDAGFDPAIDGGPLAAIQVTLAARDAAALAGFYHGLLGLELAAVPGGFALGPADRPLLQIRATPAARPERGDEPGLFHTAFLLPGRAALAGWLHHALAQGVTLQGASDHGVSEAIYLADPEGNGIEVYADRPRDAWPRSGGGGIAMFTRRLDLEALLAEAPGPALQPAATRIGHVHLRAGDLAATRDFYAGLGLAVTVELRQAAFLASGGYHHHIALNTWGNPGGSPAMRPPGLSGLLQLTLRASDAATFEAAAAAMPGAQPVQDGLLGRDPSGNAVLLVRG